MEKKVGEQYLFDFYGELLTAKQKQILEYYYDDDYSLAEIAEVMAVTRQGIFDVIKRSKAMMETYEEKLGLIAKFLKSQILYLSYLYLFQYKRDGLQKAKQSSLYEVGLPLFARLAFL